MQDELAMTTEVVKSPFSLIKRKKKAKTIFFAGDNNFICDYLLKSFHMINETSNTYRSITYLKTNIESEYRNATLEGVESVVELNSLRYLDGRCTVFFFVDCVNGLKDKDVTLAALKKINGFLRKNKSSRCVVSVLLPAIPAFSSEVEVLSEREYNYYIEKKCERRTVSKSDVFSSFNFTLYLTKILFYH